MKWVKTITLRSSTKINTIKYEKLESWSPNQRKICRWRRVWPAEQDRHILVLRALQMSNQILEWSGLLKQTPSEAKQTP